MSLPLIRETAKARREGRWAFWLLDRKGYAGEISCEECGSTVRCPKCGAAMRWEELEKRLRCLACGCKSEIPESCPNCGGLLLSGVHPGVEALYKRAEGALKYRFKNVLLLQNGEQKEFKPDRLVKGYPNGALIIGTRRLLSLCDELSPGAIGWIDADAEARSPEYDARSRAFSMVWESMWRGDSQDRKVIIQSLRPGLGWQKGLSRGWRNFWQRELNERKEWELPPYMPLIKIDALPETAEKIAAALENRAAEYWISEEKKSEIWVRTKKFTMLTEILRPFFEIKSARKGFPAVSLYLD
ncbi:MAG: hypothetical protein HUJ86_07795 [Synergistes sp.]|nr:hypothetical protein [Synergistes sp.]